MSAIAVWSVALVPGTPVSIIPQSDLKITNAALGDELADNTGRTTVKLTYKVPMIEMDMEDEENEEDNDKMTTTILCSLTPGKIEQSTLDVTIELEEEYLLEVTGKNTIYLTGNYIDQTASFNPYGNGMEDGMSEDEDEFDLREVTSDLEDGADELESDEGRFEEITEQQEVTLKRAHDDSMEIDSTVVKTTKKSNKKLKGETGEAVPAAAPTPETKSETKKSKKEKKNKEAKAKDASASEAPASAADSAPSSPAKDHPMKELPGGLKIKDAKIGTGPQAKKGNTVQMRYIGKLENGKVFDKNTKGKPFTFRLGDGDVIKGWDQGIAGMQVGGERLLTIPPALAYGKRKTGDIPAGSTLTFECKLMGIN